MQTLLPLFGLEQPLERDNNLSPVNSVTCPAVTSQAPRAVFSGTGASAGLQQLDTASE